MSQFVLTHPEPDVHLRGDDLGRSYTPDPCALAITKRVATVVSSSGGRLVPHQGVRVLEPCVGGGAFVRAARALLEVAEVHGADLDPNAPGLDLVDRGVVGDFRHAGLWAQGFDLAITNLPWGKDVGQDVTLALLARVRASATVAVVILPVDVQAQAGFEPHMRELAECWPLLPRPWDHERGCCAYVWDQRHAHSIKRGRFEPLRWRTT